MRHGFEAEHVGQKRRKLFQQRLARQQFYRLGASSARKGRGRKRALQAWEGRLSRSWRYFVKQCNDGWSASLAERLAKLRIGAVILVQPTGKDRFLETTGQTEGYDRMSGWDWTQWMDLAARKCTRRGMEVIKTKDLRSRKAAHPPRSSEDAA